MSDRKKKISELLMKEFEYASCGLCENWSNFGYDRCEDCRRKEFYWRLSEEKANEIAEKIQEIE